MDTQRVEKLETELSSLQQEVKELGRTVSDVENRLNRLEVKEEILERPEAAGDQPVRIG